MNRRWAARSRLWVALAIAALAGFTLVGGGRPAVAQPPAPAAPAAPSDPSALFHRGVIVATELSVAAPATASDPSALFYRGAIVAAAELPAPAELAAPAAASTAAASTSDPSARFHRGAIVAAGEGAIFESDSGRLGPELQFFDLGARLSLLPFAPIGHGLWHGALEVGLEPLFQRYRYLHQNFGGLELMLRYDFLGYGPLVPWFEGDAGPGGTDLNINSLHSNFTFVLGAGFGVSYFISERLAPYLGFQFRHVSNADLQPPDIGFQGYGLVGGVSYFIR